MLTNAELQAARELLGEQYTSQSLAGLEAGYEKMLALLPKLLDEIEAMRPVVDAAVAWRTYGSETGGPRSPMREVEDRLDAAIDAYRSRKATP